MNYLIIGLIIIIPCAYFLGVEKGIKKEQASRLRRVRQLAKLLNGSRI